MDKNDKNDKNDKMDKIYRAAFIAARLLSASAASIYLLTINN